MKSQGRIEIGEDEHEETQRAEVSLEATVEMEVTSTDPNGNWTLTGRFRDVDLMLDGQSQPAMAGRFAEQNFTVTYGADGKVINITGLDQVEGGMDMKQMASQINPMSIFPDRAVNVGDSWPVSSTESSDVEGDTLTETTKGTGTLREIKDGLATIDYDLDKQMTASSASGQDVGMSGGGKVKTTVIFDLEKSRITSSRSDLRVEARMQTRMGPQAETRRSVFTNQMHLELVNR